MSHNVYRAMYKLLMTEEHTIVRHRLGLNPLGLSRALINIVNKTEPVNFPRQDVPFKDFSFSSD